MQFVDFPGVSMQAAQISLVVVPFRTLEYMAIVFFLWHNPQKIHLEHAEAAGERSELDVEIAAAAQESRLRRARAEGWQREAAAANSVARRYRQEAG